MSAEASPAIRRLTERVRRLGQSFQAKLMLALLLPLLVVWTLVAATSTSMDERQRNFVGEQQSTTAKRLADELNEKIKDRLTLLEAIAAHLDAGQLSAPRYASDYLAQRFTLETLFSAGTLVFDRSGTVVGDYPVLAGRKGSNYADREYLQRVYASGKPTISQPYMGRLRPVMLISMCVPVLGVEQRILGALCGNFDMQSRNFLGRLSDPQSMGHEGFFLIRSSDRVLIASTESSRVMSQMPDTALLRQVTAGSGRAFVASSSVGVEKLYASAPVEIAGWALVLALPTDIAYAPVRATVEALKINALLASLLVMLAAFFLARRMLRPLQQAGNRMDAMSSGREPLQRVDGAGDTEVRRLLTSFNRLSDSLASQQKQLQDERNVLLRTQAELHQLNQELETKVAQRSQNLQELNALLHEVFEILPFGVVVLDQNQQVRMRNTLFGNLLDYPDALLLKEPLQFADWMHFNCERGDFPNETLQAVLDRYTHYMRTRQSVCFERQQRNGAFLEIRGLPLANGWTLLTYTDITAHRQSEQALSRALHAAASATEAKRAFVASVSYEIRTPLNAVMGLSRLLEKFALPGDAHDMVVKMRMASTLLLNMLNDVLDFSKIESGKLDIQSATFCLGDVLDNLVTVMSANAQEKDLELRIAPAPNGTRQLIGDALRLEQVLINLTGNAIRLTERGHVTIGIHKVHQDGAFLTLRFSVCDSGMDDAELRQRDALAGFPQADGLSSRKQASNSLGMAISRRLVSAMGGELHMASMPGGGSELWFALCFQDAGWLRPRVPTLLPLQDAV